MGETSTAWHSHRSSGTNTSPQCPPGRRQLPLGHQGLPTQQIAFGMRMKSLLQKLKGGGVNCINVKIKISGKLHT